MGAHGTSRGLTLPTSAQLQPAALQGKNTMYGGGDGNKKPPPSTPGAHPRYIPKRGSVLKGIVRGVLGLISTLIGATANSGGHRVLPAPLGEGGDDGAEQGK